jgi:2'-5' RNA ligase
MPAHITVLYPFLPAVRHDDAVLQRLRRICAAEPALDLELRRTNRFPETIYLEPEPGDPFRRLTTAIAAEWPEAQPYGGVFDDVKPHLTIADGVGAAVMDEIDPPVTAGLPVRARLTGAHLFVFDGRRWQPREELPFSPPTPSDPAAHA